MVLMTPMMMTMMMMMMMMMIRMMMIVKMATIMMAMCKCNLNITCYPQDTFEDYLEMFIQFGYVVLFSSAFPLAALCALLNNVIEIRSDAFKLCTNLRRPFGERVENIGTWQVRTMQKTNYTS